MKKRKTEQLFGVPPSSLDSKEYFVVYRASKKEQTSFRITKDLLDSLWSQSLKIQKKPKLVITVSNGSDEYVINCTLTKNSLTLRTANEKN